MPRRSRRCICCVCVAGGRGLVGRRVRPYGSTIVPRARSRRRRAIPAPPTEGLIGAFDEIFMLFVSLGLAGAPRRNLQSQRLGCSVVYQIRRGLSWGIWGRENKSDKRRRINQTSGGQATCSAFLVRIWGLGAKSRIRQEPYLIEPLRQYPASWRDILLRHGGYGGQASLKSDAK